MNAAFQDTVGRFRSLNRRVKFVAAANFLISAYYLSLFISSFYKFEKLPVINITGYGISFLGLTIAGYLLLKGSRIGKTITRLVGLLGIVVIAGYACYGLTFINRPNYDNIVVNNYVIEYILNIFVKYAYPLIAGYVILGLPDDRLGLK